MTAVITEQAARGSRRGGFRRIPGTFVIFAAAVVVMLGVWLLLALMYSGIGGGQNIAEARRVIAAVTSTRATTGPLQVQAILATPEYFAVTDRSGEFLQPRTSRKPGDAHGHATGLRCL